MKHKLLRSTLALLLALSLLTGCGASSKASDTVMMESTTTQSNSSAGGFYSEYATEEEMMAETDEVVTTESGEALSDPLAGKNVKLIWTANLDMETLDFDAMIPAMEQSVAEFGGYVESSYTEGGQRLSGRTYNRYGSYTVRIPAAQLDEFLNQMGTLGNVTSKSKSSENITLEYADNEARKATLELEEQKLMELLAQATELEDIITLESRLSQVHYQLDGYSSTLRKYDDLVDYSTVYISISEVQKITEVQAKTIGERISAGFSESLYELKVFGEDLIVFLIARSPILLIWAIVIAVIVVLIRKVVKHHQNKPKKEKRPLTPPTYNQPKAEEPKDDKKE